MRTKSLVGLIAFALLFMVALPLWSGDTRDCRDFSGAVYTMTNDACGNKIVVFNRDDEGLLLKAGVVATGGKGSGGALDPLGSQGSLILSENGKWLLAVNAGSNEISVFRVSDDNLVLVDRIASGGKRPVSLTMFHNLVYVLNASTPNITGFTMDHKGKLSPLPLSTRALCSSSFGQIGFDPEGEYIVVTDKTKNQIKVWFVGQTGLLSIIPAVSPSSGKVPFGFIFGRHDHLLVVEAGPNAVSSYSILENGSLRAISRFVLNGQTASCWIAGNRKYAFTDNAGSNSVSSYDASDRKGILELIRGVAGTGNKPLDMAVTQNGNFLYTLNAGNGTVGMFRIEHDGSLVNLGAVKGYLSIYAQGMAAR